VRLLLRARVTSLLQRRLDTGADTIRAGVGAADPSYLKKYEEYFWTRNIYMQRLAPLLRPGLVVPHEACLEDREILRTDYYWDFVRHLDIFRVIAGMTTHADGSPVRIAVCRSKNDRPFSRQDEKVLQALLPHFRRAFAIHDRLSQSPHINAARMWDAGFTPAESTIATRLAEGQSVAEICEALQIRQSTMRTHLQHLFQKTDTSRQAELIAWLLRR
jgi:DNA-binding CsgD family transcriptional regulator